jgi:hypothetical protein
MKPPSLIFVDLSSGGNELHEKEQGAACCLAACHDVGDRGGSVVLVGADILWFLVEMALCSSDEFWNVLADEGDHETRPRGKVTGHDGLDTFRWDGAEASMVKVVPYVLFGLELIDIAGACGTGMSQLVVCRLGCPRPVAVSRSP